jgi:hypothetical protein
MSSFCINKCIVCPNEVVEVICSEVVVVVVAEVVVVVKSC